jgi:hypothetical protein
MIRLEKDEPCLLDPNLYVLSAGDYAEDDLVELYHILNPDNLVCYHAKYVKDGVFPE